jgi:hypothetical protein
MMKKALLVSLLMVLPNVAMAADFIVCKSTYALCTTAPCEPLPGNKGFVSCKCNVTTGYSAGQKACASGQLRSRYHPIKSYARCSNNRPWAWCLDSPCMVDKNNTSQAACKCSVVQGRGDYVIVNDSGSYDAASCTTGMYSSALVTQLDDVTEFLKTHKSKLRPVPLKVYKGP